jgi:hypothetical protein
MSAETAVRLPRLGDRIIYRTHGGEDHATPTASLLRATHVPYDGEVGPPDGESGGQHSWRY